MRVSEWDQEATWFHKALLNPSADADGTDRLTHQLHGYQETFSDLLRRAEDAHARGHPPDAGHAG